MAGLLSASAIAQAPPVTISADLYTTLRFDQGKQARFHLYDDTAQFSRVRLGIGLENGWFIRVFQKLGTVPNDVDQSTLEEAFIESPGNWAAGKIYTPFGSGRILRENGYGARADTELIFLNFPLQVSAIENGKGRPRGGFVRIGSSAGISVAIGEHFGTSATSLTQIRLPEASPGEGRGYRVVYGADGKLQFGGWTFGGELLFLREGHTILDLEEDIVDGFMTYQFPTGPLVLAELCLTLREGGANFKLSSEIPFSKNLFVVPILRKYNKTGWSYAITFKVRL